MKLPLPANFFECPALTPFEVQNLQHRAIRSAMDVVKKSQLSGTDIHWTLRSDEADLKIYKGADPSALPGAYLYMGVMEVVGTLDEVVDLFQTRTTEQAKEFMKRFGKQLLDANKLYSIVEPTHEAPREMIGVTWRGYKSPLSLFVSKRDACLLECNHSFAMNGRQGWVTSLKSVNLTCCPEMQQSYGFIRMMNFGSGHVFLESATRPGYIEARSVVHVDFRGVSYDYVSDSVLKRRAWVSDMNMTRRCRNLLDIDRFLRENRLSRGTFLTSRQLVPRTNRAHCYLCNKRFAWNHPKSNCHKCGEVVCSSCNRDWCVKVHGAKTYLKACVRCALGGPVDTPHGSKEGRRDSTRVPRCPTTKGSANLWDMGSTRDIESTQSSHMSEFGHEYDRESAASDMTSDYASEMSASPPQRTSNPRLCVIMDEDGVYEERVQGQTSRRW
ncbi:Aste57867_666 [Aphanomyces stellatus]|uniref:Aste57867_666 protein n=1 Tax=Aphanomyces stellatus TaxID=120398 RepID=A0A485K3J8_9STRA|nr:hypothetical protein As57867_000665 [Aphanomyces stellatus]VFT77891.1 Aste57867_666 [Aphanomyces stellatus]